MSSPIEEIKARSDIVELIQSYVRLHKTGINYKANCPFHSEKTASFFVSPVRQIWHCFGSCGKGGDHFKFIMEIEGCDFPEALKLLAQRAGVVLKREDPAIRSEKNRLYDLCEEATQIFEKSLSLTPVAKNYLKTRGVKDDTVNEFRIGFAPQSWDFLLKALAQKGFKKEEVEKAGLAVKSEDNSSHYDRFRSRITFPISDANGRVIGFSGRIFIDGSKGKQQESRDAEAKYVNTPNTLIYDKSVAIYGFDKAKQEIKAKNKVVVVEGQMDCVMSHQAGVKNTIAVSGTALTPQHLKVLRRLCDTFVCSFDTDIAGESATKRSLALAAEFEFERWIVVIPSGKDPADAVLESPESWENAVKEAKPVVEFYFEKLFREHDAKSVEGKKAISAVFLPLLLEIANEIERSHWISEFCRRIGVKEDVVVKELKRIKSPGSSFSITSEKEADASKIPSRRDLLEERLLALLTIIDGELKKEAFGGEHYLVFTSSLNQQLFDSLRLAGDASSSDLKSHLDILRFKGEVISQITKDVSEDFFACKSELEKECIRERLLKLGEEVTRKEKEGNQAVVTSLLEDFKLLSAKLKSR